MYAAAISHPTPPQTTHSDLRFQMEEAGISADVQKKIFAEGFTSVRVFAGIEESRENVHAALKFFFQP